MMEQTGSKVTPTVYRLSTTRRPVDQEKECDEKLEDRDSRKGEDKDVDRYLSNTHE